MRTFPILLALLCCASSALSAQHLEVTLLGTGDPTPRIDRFGPATLVMGDSVRILVDAGRGSMQRLHQLDVSTADLDAIVLTHLHSDHIVGLADLLMTGWVVNRRTAPLRIIGPAGTAAFVDHLRRAFAFDIDIRASEARRAREGVQTEVLEVEDGFQWRRGGLRLAVFDVDHAPIEPAFGVRIDYAGRSVVVSGDTKYSESLIRHATGVDLLIHEVAEAPSEFKGANPTLPRLAHHTQAADAGRVFAATRPKLAVYSHLVLVGGFSARDLLPLTRQTYSGPVLVGEDLMSFLIGDTIEVRSSASR